MAITRLPNAARIVALCIASTLFAGCSFNTSAPSEGPLCQDGAKDTVTVMAPASVEIPECSEVAVYAPAVNKGRRQWCCWEGSEPSLFELQQRLGK